MVATLLWALVATALGLLWQALEASSDWLRLAQRAARGAAGAERLVGADPTPADWLAEGLKYHESPSLSPEARAYLDGTAPPASQWPDAPDWESTFVSAMERLPPGVSTDDHDGTSIGEGESIGLLAAEMVMDGAQLQLLPKAFRMGLFSPCDAECPPWPVALRFSHTAAAGQQLMRAALKIGGVGGGEVDLTFTETLKSFPIADRDELDAFVYRMQYGSARALARHPIEMGKLAAHAAQAQKCAKFIPSFKVLGKDYHSLTPYLIGGHGNTPGAMKFRMVPVGDRAPYPSVPQGGQREGRHAPAAGADDGDCRRQLRLRDPGCNRSQRSSHRRRQRRVERGHRAMGAHGHGGGPSPGVRAAGDGRQRRGQWSVAGGGQRAAFNSKEFDFMLGRSPHTPLGDINAFRASLYPVYDRARQEHLLGKTGGVPCAPFADISAWLR